MIQAPRVIAACAALCAFVDLYLEEPRIELAGLPAPEEQRSWWQRASAPWLYDGS